MKKTWGTFWNRHKLSISCILTAVTVFLAFIGSYQYYSEFADTAQNRFWSAVCYSTIKLYVFSPTVSAGAATPALYEAARWLAPLCTVYWIFKAAESFFWHSLGTVRRRLKGSRQVIVFGYNSDSRQFIEQLNQKRRDDKNARKNPMDFTEILLVTDEEIPREERLELECKSVLIYQMNFLDESDETVNHNLKKLKLDKTGAIVLFYQEATENFTIFTKLMQYVSTGNYAREVSGSARHIICSVQCDDQAVQKVITQYYQSLVKKMEKSEQEIPLSLKLFSLAGMAAERLLSDHPLYENCLEAAVNGERELSLKAIPNPHLLIAGFGTFGQAVFENALVQGGLSDISEDEKNSRFTITVFDADAKKYESIMREKHPRLDRLCRSNFIEMDIRGDGFKACLDELGEKTPFTYAAVCFSNQTTSLLTMMRLAEYFFCASSRFTPVPIAVRMEQEDSIIQYIRNACKEDLAGMYQNVIPFGTRQKLLTWKNIVNSEFEEMAMTFHDRYARASGGKKETWNALPLLKKEANRVQVLYGSYIARLVRKLEEKAGFDSEEAVSSEEIVRYHLRADKTVYNRNLELWDQLLACEHHRWCRFMYANGYIGVEETSTGIENGTYRRLKAGERYLYGPVHQCLIDDWDRFLKTGDLKDTVKYDLCSVEQYIKGTGTGRD